MTIECNCGETREHDISDFKLVINEEFGQYENIASFCENCKSWEVFNLSIPCKEEDILPSWVDQEERRQRDLVRYILKELEEEKENDTDNGTDTSGDLAGPNAQQHDGE